MKATKNEEHNDRGEGHEDSDFVANASIDARCALLASVHGQHQHRCRSLGRSLEANRPIDLFEKELVCRVRDHLLRALARRLAEELRALTRDGQNDIGSD